MSFLLIIAAAGATYIEGPRKTLDMEEALSLGIRLDVQNIEYELMDQPAPIFFQLDLVNFRACMVRRVGMDVRDSYGTPIFGTSISSNRNGTYSFRLDRSYVESTEMAIVCDDGPYVLDHVYKLKVGDLIQAP